MSMSLENHEKKNQHTVVQTMNEIDLLNEETLLAPRRFPRSGTSPTDVKSTAHAFQSTAPEPCGKPRQKHCITKPTAALI